MPTIKNASGDHSNFTMLPNFIFSLGLSPYAITLYAHIKQTAGEYGECYRSTKTLAETLKMSTGSVSEAKTELKNAGLIEIEAEKPKHGGKGLHHITIVDVWVRNAEWVKSHVKSSECSASENANSQGEHANSQGEINKNPLEEEINNNKTEPETPKQKAWRELRDMLITVSPMDLERFEGCWKEYPDFRRHQYALEQTKKFANPVSCKYYETIYLRFDPNKVNDKPKVNGRGENLRPEKEPPRYAESWVNMSRKFDKGESLQACFDRLKREGRVESNAVMWVP